MLRREMSSSERAPLEPPLQTEGLWQRWTWLGTCDARILGLFRIGLGVTVLFDLLDRMWDLRAFYSDQGVAPRSQVLESWVRMWRFSLFDAAGPPFLVYLLFAVTLACVVLFTVGYRTRLFSVLSWLMVMSFDERNLVLLDGGDGVMRLSLFWMMWADCGAAYSLDVRWLRRSSDGRAPALPLRVLQGQIMFVYAMASITKTGGQWHDGTALYHALQLSDWARPLGTWMLDHPDFLWVLTKSTVYLEAGFSILMVIPLWPVRAFGIVTILGLHAGILATMRVGLFSTIMPVSMTLFLLSRWIDWAEKKLGWYAPPRPYEGPRGSNVARVLLAAQFLAVLWTQGATRLRLLPSVRQFVAGEVELMSLWQNWAMFAPNPLGEDGYWEGPGKLANGTQLDVLAALAPHMLPDHGWYFRRWVKYRSELYADTYNGALRMFAGYLCREFNKDTPRDEQLAEFDLIYWQQPSHNPGEAPRDVKRLQKWHHRCLGDIKAPNLRPGLRGGLRPSPSPSPSED
jgi:Vitamin K-dependent gamma-carboxylase